MVKKIKTPYHVSYTEHIVDKKYDTVRNKFEAQPATSLKDAKDWVKFLKKDKDIIDIKIIKTTPKKYWK